MGAEAWEKVWGPLLRGKFGDRADEISMSWLWSRFRVHRQPKGQGTRREVLGYPHDSFEGLFRALAASVEERGGRVLIDRPAARLDLRDGGFEVVAGASDSFRRGHDPRTFDQAGEPEFYDG